MREMQILDDKGEFLPLSNLLVWTYMAHPDDEDFRGELFTHLSFRGCVKAAEKKQAGFRVSSDFASVLARTPSTEAVWDRAADSLKPGAIVGQLLLLLLVCNEQKPEWASVRKAKQVLAKALHTNKNPIERAWSKYKCVSHLWSAFILAQINLKGRGQWQEGSLPGFLKLSNEGLAVFLSYAEKIRGLAEKLYPPLGAKGKGKTSIPLFKRDDAWRCPESLSLPAVKFPDLPPLESHLKTLYEAYRVTTRKPKMQ
jgi:hypothetical protein